jgi:chemotaxis protein methyltransferase CheR
MLADELTPLLGGTGVDILGTDIARDCVARARAGCYSQFEVQRGLPVRYLVRHFRSEAGQWQASEALRAAVRFEVRNLLADHRPLGLFDVIFCRNVLIYFDQTTKSRVLAALAAQLAPDGALYLGGAESVLGLTDRLTPIAGERCAFHPAPSWALAS